MISNVSIGALNRLHKIAHGREGAKYSLKPTVTEKQRPLCGTILLMSCMEFETVEQLLSVHCKWMLRAPLVP
jgi:hypothetical protein